MIGVRHGLATAVVALAMMLSLLDVGLAGWTAGVACALVLAGAAARRAVVDGVDVLGPADLVTVTRATLACSVAALAAQSATTGSAGEEVVAALVPITVVALALDFVDGRVARLTGTVSAYGARLDGEADAFLILVLSAYVARSAGAWVLALGLVRYAYAVVAHLVPWMRRDLPPRYWRKVVAAFVGIALTVAASGTTPAALTSAGLVVSAVLLAESFGWDVVWLWRRRAPMNPSDPRDVGMVRTSERNR